MNIFTGIGRLTRDPEPRYSATGTAITNFTVAIDRSYKSKSGEKQTDFLPCVCFGKTAEIVAQYVHKGSQIAIEGEVNVDKYDKDGEKKIFTKINVRNVQFLDGKQAQQQEKPAEDFGDISFSDDDVPF